MNWFKKKSLNRCIYRTRKTKKKTVQLIILTTFFLGIIFSLNQVFATFDCAFYDEFDNIDYSKGHWNDLSINDSEFLIFNSRLIPNSYGNGSKWKGPKWGYNVFDAGNFELTVKPFFSDFHPSGRGVGAFEVVLYSGVNGTGEAIFSFKWEDTNSSQDQGQISFYICGLEKYKSGNQTYKDWYYESEHFNISRTNCDDITFMTHYRGKTNTTYSTITGPKMKIGSITVQALKFSSMDELSTSLNSFQFNHDAYGEVSSYSYVAWIEEENHGSVRMWFKIHADNMYYTKIEYRILPSTNFTIIHWACANYTVGFHTFEEMFDGEEGQTVIVNFYLYKSDNSTLINMYTEIAVLQS